MLLVCNIHQTVFICLDHIVQRGSVEIKNERQKTVHNHHFQNSNYEKVDLNQHGHFTVKVNFENEIYTRHIHIGKEG